MRSRGRHSHSHSHSQSQTTIQTDALHSKPLRETGECTAHNNKSKDGSAEHCRACVLLLYYYYTTR
jgi:hypothetical protein